MVLLIRRFVSTFWSFMTKRIISTNNLGRIFNHTDLDAITPGLERVESFVLFLTHKIFIDGFRDPRN